MYGVKIPENLADDMPDEKDLPYLEMLYKFVFGKQSYYDLQMTRHVEAQAGERAEEKELRRPTTERYSAGASTTDEGGAERIESEGSQLLTRTAPQRGRKKQHWQVPPKTRVRVKNRIKRWVGYLCVLRI